MKTNTSAPNYKGFRFPPEIIGHAVWLSFRFSLSYRDVEELLAQRGIVVTYETVRQWCLKFGQTYANELRMDYGPHDSLVRATSSRSKQASCHPIDELERAFHVKVTILS